MPTGGGSTDHAISNTIRWVYSRSVTLSVDTKSLFFSEAFASTPPHPPLPLPHLPTRPPALPRVFVVFVRRRSSDHDLFILQPQDTTVKSHNILVLARVQHYQGTITSNTEASIYNTLNACEPTKSTHQDALRKKYKDTTRT